MKDESEKPKELKARTKSFASRIIRMYGALPTSTEAQVMRKQELWSGTSVGAPYREATRARSTAEFISKIEGGSAELEETAYWIELLTERGIVPSAQVEDLQNEAHELSAIFVSKHKECKKQKND